MITAEASVQNSPQRTPASKTAATGTETYHWIVGAMWPPVRQARPAYVAAPKRISRLPAKVGRCVARCTRGIAVNKIPAAANSQTHGQPWSITDTTANNGTQPQVARQN